MRGYLHPCVPTYEVNQLNGCLCCIRYRQIAGGQGFLINSLSFLLSRAAWTWLIIFSHSLAHPLWVTCCLGEASVAQGPLSHSLSPLNFDTSSLEDLTNALPSMRTPKSLCNEPTKKGIYFSIIKGWSGNSGDMECARGSKHSLFPCGLVTKLCSRDGLYPYSYLQDDTVLKTPEEACYPQTQNQASKSSMPPQTLRWLQESQWDRTVLTNQLRDSTLLAIQCHTNCSSWLKKSLIG